MSLAGDFFFKLTSFFFKTILSGTLSGCQTIWIQIRTHPYLDPNRLQRLESPLTRKELIIYSSCKIRPQLKLHRNVELQWYNAVFEPKKLNTAFDRLNGV